MGVIYTQDYLSFMRQQAAMEARINETNNACWPEPELKDYVDVEFEEINQTLQIEQKENT